MYSTESSSRSWSSVMIKTKLGGCVDLTCCSSGHTESRTCCNALFANAATSAVTMPHDSAVNTAEENRIVHGFISDTILFCLASE